MIGTEQADASDPVFAVVSECVARAARSRGLRRVVLYVTPGARGLRFLHSAMQWFFAEMTVVGVDSADELRRLLGPQDICTVEHLLLQYWSEFTSLPASIRTAVLLAAREPAQNSVKVVAARAGVSVRTVERTFVRAGLPHPGEFLRRFRRAAG